MQTLTVNADSKSYPIHIGRSIDLSALLGPYVADRQVMVVTNTVVKPLYFNYLYHACDQAAIVKHCELPDGEQYKNDSSMRKIYDALMQSGFNRDCVVIALGGGVVGDMAGFAAATFQRGVDFIQIPTTLLAQVDSSVGGKTGINHPQGKNMIGAFKQPEVVLIDTNMLDTLPDNEVSAGLAEIIKYALIADTQFLQWLEANMTDLVNRSADALIQAIYRSCQHKAKIVAEDELESGKRALLNLGHTFGHAIENHMGYGNWLHGEAVAVGMLQAAHLSFCIGWLSAQDVKRIYELVSCAKLPVKPPGILPEDALSLMYRDKKVKAGKLRLVLLKQLGEAVIVDDIDRQVVIKTLGATDIMAAIQGAGV